MHLLRLGALIILSFQFSLQAQTVNLKFNEVSKIVDQEGMVTYAESSISSIEIVEIEPSQSFMVGDGLGDVIIIVDKLIALGKKIWPIIEAGKPVSHTDFTTLHVLPNVGGTHVPFYKMENWSAPKFKSYKIVYKNGFGAEVVNFNFTVMFQYGGTYDGHGKYLTGINIIPNNLEVDWGFKFDAKSALISIANMGSKDDPVASATVKLSFRAESFLKVIDSSITFHMDGSGNITKF